MTIRKSKNVKLFLILTQTAMLWKHWQSKIARENLEYSVGPVFSYVASV